MRWLSSNRNIALTAPDVRVQVKVTVNIELQTAGSFFWAVDSLQFVKIILAFYGNRRFVTMFIKLDNFPNP